LWTLLSRRGFLAWSGAAAAGVIAGRGSLSAAAHEMPRVPRRLVASRRQPRPFRRFRCRYPPSRGHPRTVPRRTAVCRSTGWPMRPARSESAPRTCRPLVSGVSVSSFPGPTIEARRGQPLAVQWINQLPPRHFLPIDHTIHGAEPGVAESRAVVHVHGARGAARTRRLPRALVFCRARPRSRSIQTIRDAATLWYHDHTMGINRLNVYAGLMGLYLIRDDRERSLGLPDGQFDIPLLICDRLLRTDGQLDYPTSGDPRRAVDRRCGRGCGAHQRQNCFPYLQVQPRSYRLRLVNASNGRFFAFRLSNGERAPPDRQRPGDCWPRRRASSGCSSRRRKRGRLS